MTDQELRDLVASLAKSLLLSTLQSYYDVNKADRFRGWDGFRLGSNSGILMVAELSLVIYNGFVGVVKENKFPSEENSH